MTVVYQTHYNDERFWIKYDMLKAMIDVLFSKPYLKVFSAIFSNLCAAWMFAVFINPNPISLTVDLFAAILTLSAAIWIEKLLERYEYTK